MHFTYIHTYISLSLYIYIYINRCVCVYMYIYIYIPKATAMQVYLIADRSPTPGRKKGALCLGIITSQDFDVFLRSCCADWSSTQISTMLVGKFTMENDSLRKTLPRQLRRQMSKSWLAKLPTLCLRSSPAPKGGNPQKENKTEPKS